MLKTILEKKQRFQSIYELVDEMPKTPVGKIFKPELRKRAITRVYNEALEKAGLPAEVQEVIDHPKKGLTAMVAKNGVNDTKQIGKILDKFIFLGSNSRSQFQVFGILLLYPLFS